MKKYIFISAVLLSTLVNAETNTQLDKGQILDILNKSAKTSNANTKRTKYNKVLPSQDGENIIANGGKILTAKSFKEAEIRSGIILPKNNTGIHGKETDPYAYLPYGSLPNVPIKSHHTASGIPLEKRYKIISGEPVVVEKKIKTVATTEKKIVQKKITDPIDVLY